MLKFTFALLLCLPFGLTAQSGGFTLRLEQGISALNDFSSKDPQSALGGYAAALYAEHHFTNGLYLAAGYQSSRGLSYYDTRNTGFRVPENDEGISGFRGSALTTEHRLGVGGGISGHLGKLCFSTDLQFAPLLYHKSRLTAHADYDGFPGEYIEEVDGKYNENFSFDGVSRFETNFNAQLQLGGRISYHFGKHLLAGVSYRTDLRRRELTLLTSKFSDVDNFVAVQAKDYRFAVATMFLGCRL